ncbi:hypothetical protein [Poinsettia branch-inducing phytoplasma]|uniref:hypothetical protein n=1 Tax=Poinsettia branch-inducing phytoplasma TaxID=138647 RepID=UPI0003691063|nr:hypothetical protein [Poinsettia branch-inducing phytoplasma]
MNKKITKKTNQKNQQTTKNKEELKQTKPIEEETIYIPKKNKSHRLKKIAYITIILHFILQVIIIYYDNQIPWLTTGIDNFINLIKSIIPGGTK